MRAVYDDGIPRLTITIEMTLDEAFALVNNSQDHAARAKQAEARAELDRLFDAELNRQVGTQLAADLKAAKARLGLKAGL